MGGPQYKRPRVDIPPNDMIMIDDSEDSTSDSSEEGKIYEEKSYTCRVCLDPNSRARYICPRCLTRSCSLACSQTHKTKYNCSGIRDRTKYKGKGHMTEEDLKSDLSVLVDASVAIESATRVDSSIALRSYSAMGGASRPNTDQSGACHNLSKALKDLIVKEHGVIFRQSPSCSARRQRNTTTHKKKKLKWRVEWLVYITPEQAEGPVAATDGKTIQGSVTDVSSIQLGENEPSVNMLKVDPTRPIDLTKPIDLAVKWHLGSCDLKIAIDHAIKNLNLEIQESDLVCLIRDESVPNDQRGFIILDSHKSINDNLRGLVVIDFATIYLVAKSLLKSKEYSKSYDFDVTSLPQWAQMAAPTRRGHVYSFLNKPVYSRSFRDIEPTSALTDSKTNKDRTSPPVENVSLEVQRLSPLSSLSSGSDAESDDITSPVRLEVMTDGSDHDDSSPLLAHKPYIPVVEVINSCSATSALTSSPATGIVSMSSYIEEEEILSDDLF